MLFRVVALGRRLTSSRNHPFVDVSLTSAQLDALLLLAHLGPTLSPGSLSQSLGLTPGAVTQLVQGLVDEGLVVRDVDPDDARVRRLALTDSARRQVTALEDATVDEVRPWFAGLDDAEVEQLARLLARVEPRHPAR